MSLKYLIPHLDSEIDRLQKARDLLAYTPPTGSSDAGGRNIFASSVSIRLTASRDASKSTATGVTGAQGSEGALTGDPNNIVIKTVRLRKPRMLNRNQSLEREPRTYRKRPLPALDTALRCSVPLGPVIVSAEEVRKSQAAKAAQATLAAEVKRSGAEPAFQWLHKSDDSRSVDALLQRLMNIGADETERSAELLPSLG